jgi:hypothetical protein
MQQCRYTNDAVMTPQPAEASPRTDPHVRLLKRVCEPYRLDTIAA